jgi:hypothetical protein
MIPTPPPFPFASHPDPLSLTEKAIEHVYDVLCGGAQACTDEYQRGVMDAVKLMRMARALS